MQNQDFRVEHDNDDDDDRSVEICLDTLTITQSPPTPKVDPATREKRRDSSRLSVFPQQGSVMGSPGYSMRQSLNEKALELYSDDDSVYLSDDNEVCLLSLRAAPIKESR